MPKEPATQHKPADSPAAVANIGAGRGPRNIANTAAPITASTNAVPSVFAMFADFACASVTPLAALHALPNSTGEYHSAPRIMLDAPAASTANILISGIGAHPP